ncbi:hypothetical protein [Chelativorans alearense]|uniref:hypothetical protein n=1 Tax=Chelativorans alearense TaxID=2681495 RepID=UPI0013D04F9E|nr:hypothetical protein [Chelativorans alearense]
MAEATNELMYELLKRMQHDLTELRADVSEVKTELNVIRGHMIGIQTDIHNIYGILSRHDDRLDRIERRLELREMAESPQKPYDPNA